MTMNRTRWIVCAGAALAVCGAAAATYFLWFRAAPVPDPKQAPRQSVLEYMASDEFGSLSEDERKEYFDKIRQRGEDAELMRKSRELSEAQQEALRKNVGPVVRRMMRERVQGYFKTPEDQRDAYLDAILAEMPVMRAEAGGDESKKDDKKRRPNFTPDRLREMIGETSPLERAQFMTFMAAMQKRIRERRGG